MMCRLLFPIACLMISADGQPAGADGGVVVTRIDGTVVEGVWSPTSQAGHIAVQLPSGQQTIAEQDLLSVQFPGHFLKAEEGDWTVTVWGEGGSMFPANLLEGSVAALSLQTPFADRLVVPLDDLAALQWRRHGRGPEAVAAQLADRDSATDVLLAIQGDKIRRVHGRLERLDAEGGSFAYKDRSLSFHAGNALALVFARPASRSPAPAVCVLNSGDRIAGHISGTTDETIALRGIANSAVTVAVQAIREIRFHSDRLVYLSDRRPDAMEQRSFFDVSWPVRFDRAVSNRAMSMAGRTYARGIGVHAGCSLTYALQEDFRRLAATIGIDDAARPSGHVVFRVIADDREVFSSGPVTGQDEPRHIVVDLEGARRLTLVVDWAEQLDIGDHANWANIRLIR